MDTLNTVIDIRKNIPKYDSWKKEQNDREAQRQALHNSVKHSPEELKQARKYGKTMIDAISIMDSYSEEKAKQSEISSFLISLPFGIVGYILAPILMKPLIHHNGIKISMMHKLVAGLGFVATSIPANIYADHLQKGSAKLARYQAREKELKDPRNFVIYSDEQINEAKKIAPDIKIEQEKQNNFLDLSEISNSVRTLIKDNKDYKKWKRQLKLQWKRDKKEIFGEKTEKKEISFNRPSEESLKKAKLEQDIIFRVTSKINNSAEDYAQNTEAAAGTLIQSSLVGGTIIGKIVSYIPGISQKVVNQFSKNKNAVKKEARMRMVHNWVIPVFTAAVTTSLSFLVSMNLHREATRVGRFKARQDLLKDSRNFIAYTDEQFETVKDVKADNKKKSFLQKSWDNLIFIPKAVKYQKEYSNYRRIKLKEEKQLREALKQIDITEEQLTGAKNTQYKLFKTFEKIDEISQGYSGDMEILNSITLQLLPYALGGVILSPAIYAFSHIMYGNKIKGANKLISDLSKISKGFDSKQGNKFLSELESNISDHIAELKTSTSKSNTKPVIKLPSEIMAKKNKESVILSISEFKDKISSLNEAELKEYLLTMPDINKKDLKHLNKKQIIKFFDNCQKVVKDLPEEPTNKFIKQMVEIQTENPEAFNKLVKNSKIGTKIANTSIASQLAYGYGIGSTVVLWLLLSYFADLQKKACRIGVMEAMESLKDPANFVDKYPELTEISAI